MNVNKKSIALPPIILWWQFFLPLIGYTANKIGLQEINIGDEYVICGHFQGMDPAGVPLFQVLVIKSLEDL